MKIRLKSIEKIQGGKKPKRSLIADGELLHTKDNGYCDAFTSIMQDELVGRIIEVTPMLDEDGDVVPNWFSTVPGFSMSYEFNIHRSWFTEVD
jgi:hypothetical protein